GPVPGGLPSLAFPAVSLSETLALVPVAASCFVVIVAQSAATARVFALRYRERVDEDADILGLAAANAAAAVGGAFVVNGSPTQTAMADRAGASSQIAQLTTAAVVFTIAAGLIDVASLREIVAESPGEFILAMVTAAAVAIFGIDQGILLAVG